MASHRRNEEERPERRSGPGDYFQLGTRFLDWEIDYQTAARIGRKLDRRKRPRWIKFVDLHGGRVWLRTDTITYVAESSERNRSRFRMFEHLRGKECYRDRRLDSYEDEDRDE